MVNLRTSQKPEKSSQKQEIPLTLEMFKKLGATKLDTGKFLRDKRNIGAAIVECLENNDPEGVMEALEYYLEAVNKSAMRKKGKLAKTTMYHAMKKKNPTLKTLAKIVSSCRVNLE